MNVSFPKCNQAGTEFVISTTDDLQEKVNYLSEDFPVAIFTQTYHHAASDSTPFHWHNELQLNWVSEGELEYCINGDSLRLSGDKILLVKDHQLHSSRTTGKDTCSLCINFSPDIFHPMILKHYIQPFLENENFTSSIQLLNPGQINILESLLDQTSEPLGYFSIVNFLSQVFEELIRSFDEKPDQNDKEEKELFQSMLSFVHSHYQDPLTVRQIAAYWIINKNRCTDLFRKYTRLSPIKYLNEYRLYMAKNLILNTKKPISEISADVGYNQISHFIEQFRGAYGLSPLKYRNQFAGQSSDRTSSLS